MATTDITRAHRSALQPAVPPIEVDRAQVREAKKPWLAMGLLLLAASAERTAVHATGFEQEIALGWAAAAFCTAVVVGHRSRHRLMGKHLRRRFIAAVWSAAGWLMYVGACGLTWGAAATLTAVGATLSLLFWREHRIHGRPKGRPLNLQPVGDGDMFATRWENNLAGKGKQFAESELTEMEIIRSGYRYTLELVPGEHTIEMVMGAVARIRSGLQLLPGQEVIIEVHPDLPSPAALLTIVTKSTIRVDLPWPGPERAWDAERGSVVMGPFADGEGVALFSIYRKDGMFGGFIQGGTGSGKSRALETIALACASSVSHPTVVWFACGQNGDSSPLLMEKADATASTPEQLLKMLDAAIQVGRINGLENRVNGLENRAAGLRGFQPTPDRPGLLIFVDEFHNFLNEKKLGKLALTIQDRMAMIIRELRKAGVALILATQDPLLGAFGHPKGADVMRANLLVGNGIMMRSESNNAKQVFKVDVNARDFPDLPGYGYLARPFPGDRQAPFRFYYVNDEAIKQWADSFTWRSLSVKQARMVEQFAGRWYATRHEQAAAQREKDRRLLADLESEIFTPDVTAPAGERFTPTTGGAGVTGMPGFDEVVKFWEKTPAPVHEPSAANRLGEGHQKVLAAILGGANRPQLIMDVTGLGKTRVHDVLKELTAMELIHQPTGYGTYALLPAARVA